MIVAVLLMVPRSSHPMQNNSGHPFSPGNVDLSRSHEGEAGKRA